jgi:hypothetical protein
LNISELCGLPRVTRFCFAYVLHTLPLQKLL